MSAGHKTLALCAAGLGLLLGGVPADAHAAWQQAGTGRAYAKARTMPSGNVPTATVSGSNITVAWTASSFSGGGAVSGYQVKRYDASNQSQTVLANCAGTISGLTCTENAVPPGVYRYTVTPKHANWIGAESAKSSSVEVLRIPPGDRAEGAWSVSDAVSGTAADASSTLAFDDSSLFTTAATPAAFSSARYIDIDLSGSVPSGLTPQAVNFDFDFSDDNGDAKATCVYFEVRRASTGAVLGTYGSAAAPVDCESGNVPQMVTTAITGSVNDTTAANDLRIRVFASDAGANTWRIDQARVRYRAYGKDYSLYPTTTNDNLAGGASSVPWGPALQDGVGLIPASNWPTAFDTAKYLQFTFPSNIPGSATINSVSLEHRYRSSAAGSNACYYFDVRSGGSVIGSHGNGTTPASCNSTTTYATDTIALPEVDTPAEVNALAVRLYGRSSGAKKTEHDVVRLHVDYSLASTGCSDSGTTTLTAGRDSWADQNAPTSTTGGTATTVSVKTQNGSRNRRSFLYFSLPSLGDGCTIQSATLRLFQSTTAGTRTVQVSRATSAWTEAGLNWNTQPGSAGTPVGMTANLTNAWLEWNVGTLVDEQSSSGNYGFVLKDSAEDAATAAENKFSSREGGNPPQLVLTTG